MTKQSRVIIVGMQLEETDKRLLERARTLAARTGSDLHLVHGLESSADHALPPIIGPGYADMLEGAEIASLARATDALKKYETPGGPAITTRALRGPAARILIAEAISKGAWMILVGTRTGDHRFVPPILSTPKSLFNHSPVPVMVAADAAPPFPEKGPLHVLCSTDMMNQTTAAEDFAAGLVLGDDQGGRLTVLHINPLTEEVLEAGISDALFTARADATIAISPGEIFRDISGRLEEGLRDRVAFTETDNHQLRVHLRHGRIRDELSTEVEEQAPDLLVFGKHKGVHKEPFYFGRLPFSMAFRFGLCFVVVP